MPATTNFGFTKPDESTNPFDCGTDIVGLADSMDLILPKTTYGAGAPPTAGVRDGDFHFQPLP